MLLSSGFQAINTNRAQAQLATPDITELANELSTQMVVRLTSIDNSYGYEVQTSIGSGVWLTVKLSTAAREIILTDLVPGTVYNVRARAVRLQRLEHARFAHGDVRKPAAFSRQLLSGSRRLNGGNGAFFGTRRLTCKAAHLGHGLQ